MLKTQQQIVDLDNIKHKKQKQALLNLHKKERKGQQDQAPLIKVKEKITIRI